MAISNFSKLRLLVWKNWALQWNHKTQLVWELFTPALFVLLLVWLRDLVKPIKEPTTMYNESLPIDNLDLLKLNLNPTKNLSYNLVYSPNTSVVFDRIVREAAANLGLTYSGYANSDALERSSFVGDYLAGVDFGDSQAAVTVYPTKLKYSIRFPIELRTSSLIETWATDWLFHPFDLVGPRNPDDADGGIPVGYLREGFLPVQNAISMAFIGQTLKQAANRLPTVMLQRYPYPEFVNDPLVALLSVAMALIILISFMYPIMNTVRYITLEKEKQLKEVMKILGLQNWLHWVAWFLKAFLTMGFSTYLVTWLICRKGSSGAAVLTYSSFSAVYFFLMIYVINGIFLCFMLATFFSRAGTASTITGLIWFVIYLPYLHFQLNYESVSMSAKLFGALLPNTALGLGIRIIVYKEGQGEGLQWKNMFLPASLEDSLSMDHVLGMMVLSSVICMIICLYIEQVYPGKFGIPKPWDFPFKKRFWFGEKPGIVTYSLNSYSQKGSEGAFESEPPDKAIVLQIKHLTKVFGDKIAVNDLSLNMYEGEITMLLGHNGAGKTTIISILTGMFPPTSGTAIINGYDIRTNIEGARMSLGLCPQHNILFDDLTVRDHLVFYSCLKGLEGYKLKTEVNTYLKKIELNDKANVLSSNLSGGMKRKLSVCTALCGGTKVVICDEPSSGMDPAARRQLWKLLQSEKNGRTLLMTTHFMDEADVLGDRIAVMCDGELKCYGTSFFLKKNFGDGYRLICVKKTNCESAKVTALLSKSIPGLQPHTETGAELSYLLPDAYSPKFEAILQVLEKNSAALNLNGYGIMTTTLEDVFIKFGAEEKENLSSTASDQVDDDSEISDENQPLFEGISLCLSQWRSMFLKKYISAIRNKVLFAIQIFMPIFFIVGTVLSKERNTFTHLNALPISLSTYPKTVTVLEMSPSVATGSLEAQIGIWYEQIITSMSSDHKFVTTGGRPFNDYMLEIGKTIQLRINERYIAAATVSKGRIIAWLNNKPLHSAPLSVNLIHNAISKAAVGPDVSISVTNHPMPASHDLVVRLLSFGINLGTEMAINLCVCMCLVSSLYVMFIIQEQMSRAKLLQFVGGVKVTTFWFSHFLCDLVMFTIMGLVVIITLACFQEKGYSSFEELMRNFFIIFLFGVSVLPFTYLQARGYTEPATGFARLSIRNMFCGVMLFTIVIALKSGLVNTNIGDTLEKIFLIFPHFTFAEGINNLYTNSQLRDTCASLTVPSPHCQDLKPFFDWEAPGVRLQIQYFLVTACVFLSCLLVLECRVFKSPCCNICPRSLKPEDGYYDEDVENERKRVEKMSKKQLKAYNLVMDKLSKFYGSLECFGLLGVNGAGKTTTFKMLIGDVDISSGEAYVKGIRLKKHMNAVYKMIGYCPQFDALFDEFTGSETLRMYCLLCGISAKKISAISDELAKSFGFQKHCDKQIYTYSGGSKRKLSTALAVIGNPEVIYLDEPTTGMDPASRRSVCTMFCRIRDSGKAIILTSHSMEECEALCTRLAIMVNGEFKCIGPTQYLKNKFSKGFVLKLKLKKDFKARNVELVTSFVMGAFTDAVLQDQLQGILTFYIPVANVEWSKIFGLVEANKSELSLDDYSVSQTTLEEIFLQFAKYQREDS